MSMKLCRPLGIDPAHVTVSLAEDEYPAWQSSQTYALNARVIHAHGIWQSTIADNQGIDPTGEDQQSAATTRWNYRGSTNAFAFLNMQLSTATEASGELIIEIDNIQNAEALILFRVKCLELSVEGFNRNGTKIYEAGQILGGRAIDDWYEWYFAPFEPVTDKFWRFDLISQITKLRLRLIGDVIQLGEIFLGDAIRIGVMRATSSPSRGEVISHSRSEFNDWGTYQNIDRPKRTEMSFNAQADAELWNAVFPTLMDYAGRIVALIGDEKRSSTIRLGALGEVSWEEPKYAGDYYFYTLSIKGIS